MMRRIYEWLWVNLPYGGGRWLGPWLMRKALWRACPVCRGLGWNREGVQPGPPAPAKWYACGWCWSKGYQYRGSAVGKPKPRPRNGCDHEPI